MPALRPSRSTIVPSFRGEVTRIDRRGDAELRGGGALEELANSGQINGPVLARAFTYMHLHRLRLMEDEGTDARAVCFISARLRKVSGNGIGSPRELLDTEAGGKNQLRGRGASFTVIDQQIRRGNRSLGLESVRKFYSYVAGRCWKDVGRELLRLRLISAFVFIKDRGGWITLWGLKD